MNLAWYQIKAKIKWCVLNMVSSTWILIRLVCMCLALLGLMLLFRLTLFDNVPMTVFGTVYSNCILILVSLNYYCIGKFFYTACNPAKNVRPVLEPGYLDVGQTPLVRSDRCTEIHSGMPRLTIHNVWILVYGLGLVLFVVSYCFLSMHPVCLACVGIAMGVLSLDELVCPRRRLAPVYASIRASVMICGSISLLLVSADVVWDMVMRYVLSTDLYSICFGLLLPFVSQFIMVAVRDTRHFTLGNMAQICEFGFPFTAFLGVFHLSVAYGQRFQMDTDAAMQSYLLMNNGTSVYDFWYRPANITFQQIIRTDGPFLIYYGLAPFLLVPMVMCYVACVLEGSCIDPLLSLGMTLSIYRFAFSVTPDPSLLGVYGALCCGVGCLVRVTSEGRLMQDPPRLQSETTQLTRRDVLEREMRECQEPDVDA